MTHSLLFLCLWGCPPEAPPIKEDTQEADADADADVDADADADPSLRFHETIYKSTHNSYSGGARGSIEEQLDAGVRQLEIDFHDNSYDDHGFRVGHDSPGDETEHAGSNPDTLALGDWLEHIGSWSTNHPTHAPITLILDIKDDLTDNRHTLEGSLTALNLLIDSSFGSRLFTPADHGNQWPTVESMRGKVLTVLSGAGEVNSRLAYIRDQGSAPTVAMNDSGQVIEVHKSESSDTLWYWTGQRQSDGTVLWLHHGRFDNGREPAIALNNAGWFVEVHTSENQEDLWYWTGYLDTTGDLVFVGHDQFDNGRRPSIRFNDRNGTELLEIHQSDSNANQNWDWELVLNTSTGELIWGDHGTTNSARHDTDSTTSGAGTISVHTGQDSAGADILTYETSTGSPARIRYPQRAFVDTFPGESALLEETSSFRGYEHGDSSLASTWRGRGGLARIFEFQASDIDPSEMAPQFPSTDEPFEQWYTTWWETQPIAQP